MSRFINIIINPVGDSCNLKCSYCYTSERVENNGRLPEENIISIIDYVANEQELTCISFTWHGGEPLLMGMDYFEKILKYQRKKLINKLYYNIIQTNGVLINVDWVLLFKRYNINIGVSIDGPDYLCNSSRFSSENEFRVLLDNLELMKKMKLLPALFCTITENNVNQLDKMFDFIEDYKTYAYMFNPVMDSKYAISSSRWKEILLKMHYFSERVKINNTLTYHIDNGIVGKMPELCLINGMCNKFISIDNKGNIFASCINHDMRFLLAKIEDNDVWKRINEYINSHMEIKEDSIYARMGKELRYKYFQGNGCKKCRSIDNNNNFVGGIIQYMCEIQV